MAGYLFNKRIGAILYNAVHFRGLAIGIYLSGVWLGLDLVALAGIIMLLHSTMDRILGYGLKLFEGFKYTHLGQIQ